MTAVEEFDFARTDGGHWDSRSVQRDSLVHPVRVQTRADFDGDYYMADVTEAVCDGCGWADHWYGISNIDEDEGYARAEIEAHCRGAGLTIEGDE